MYPFSDYFFSYMITQRKKQEAYTVTTGTGSDDFVDSDEQPCMGGGCSHLLMDGLTNGGTD
jgi:hypothetical protein